MSRKTRAGAEGRAERTTVDPLAAGSRHQIVHEWNDGPEPRPPGLLPEMIADRASRFPDAVALVGDSWCVTYGDLLDRSERLATGLRERGVGPETVVAVLLEPSGLMVAALLAIWRAGGAFLPLDPEHPPERMGAVLQDGLCAKGDRLVVTTARLARSIESLRPALAVEAYLVDAPPGPRTGPTEPMGSPSADHARLLAENAAYVLFTSGSTGRPKGIVISHGALANRLAWTARNEVGADDAFLHKTTLTFDVALAEIFSPLLAGGRCVLSGAKERGDPRRLAERIARDRVSVASFPPSLLATLLDRPDAPAELATVRVLITGGETVPPALPARVDAVLATTLYNRYGPTETTISVVTGVCDPTKRSGSVPLGRPIAGAKLYVLDELLHPRPAGVGGEICVGGSCLARGYAGRPGLTAERFAPDPLSGAVGGRLYRTGDRGAWRTDGQLEFLGRIDRQVKIRGFRVELEEVEGALAAHPRVREAAVTAPEERATGSRRLVGHVVVEPPGDVDAAELRRFLARRLPAYMIPSRFVLRDRLPRTLSGKIDRSSLEVTGTGSEVVGRDERKARSGVGPILTGLALDLLQVSSIDPGDDLLSLGFHSLLLVRLQERVRETLGVDLKLAHIARAGSIRGLCRLIERGENWNGVGPEDLAREATLGPEDRPTARRLPDAGSPRAVLVTGATGYLGSHVLAEILRRTEALVFCLVRAPDEQHGGRLLREVLGRWGLDVAAAEERLVPLPGDLGRPGLGLGKVQIADLADRLDAIYHCGAQVQLTLPYEALGRTNVDGTREMLRLAARGRPKAFHYVSTLSVLEDACSRDVGSVPERRLDRTPVGLTGGYRQSKWVAERLVQAAIGHGLAAVVYRPGWLTGSTETAEVNPSDFLMRVVTASLDLGLIPRLGPIEVCPTPVDWAARALVSLSLRPESLGGVFHLVNPRPVPFKEAVGVARELGHALREVPPPEWAAALARFGESDGRDLLGPLVELLRSLAATRPEGFRGDGSTAWQPLRFDSSRTREALGNPTDQCPLVDRRLIARYLAALLGRERGALSVSSGKLARRMEMSP